MCLSLISSHQNTFVPKYFFLLSRSQITVSCLFDKYCCYTFLAGGPSICRVCAVTHVASALLHTPAPVVANTCRAAAVTRTARAHTRGRLGPLVQVKGHTIYMKRSHAAQKASLSGSCSSYNKENDLVLMLSVSNTVEDMHCYLFFPHDLYHH